MNTLAISADRMEPLEPPVGIEPTTFALQSVLPHY